MKKISKRVISFVLAFVMVLGLLPISKTSVAKAEGSRAETEKWLEEKTPINGGYYRVWNDAASTDVPDWKHPDTRMGDIPKEVDLVLAFFDNELAKIPTKVMKEYVAKLHGNGQKVVGSIFAHILYDDIEYYLKNEELVNRIKEEYKEYIQYNFSKKREVLSFPNSEIGNKKRADFILEYYMNMYDFDGIDIDMEKTNDEFKGKEDHYNKVLEILSQNIGPKSNSDKLLIYDTTRSAFHPAFEKHSDKFDLVLIQMYGNRSEYKNTEEYKNSDDFRNNLEFTLNKGLTLFETFSSLIPTEKILIGFSFYEENSYGTKTIESAVDNNRWYDIPTTANEVEKMVSQDGSLNSNGYFVPGEFSDSRAARYAEWQHKFGLKGGVFSYAIDRDGVKHPTKQQAKDMYDQYSKFKGNGDSIDIESWVRANRPGKSDSDDLKSTDYAYSKQLKNILRKNNEYEIIDNTDFKDEALKNQIIQKVSKYKGNIERFNGDLVLDDPEIKDLTGLNKLKNIKSVTLKGLVNLEVLDLSNMNLEKLNIENPEQMTKLTKVDLSNNRLDLSKDTENRKVLDALHENIMKTQSKDDKSVFAFEEQDILGYYPEKLDPDTVKLEIHPEANYDLNALLTQTVTAQGIDISDESKLQALKNEEVFGRKYIKSNVNFEDIKKNYEGFTFKIRNSISEVIPGNEVNRDKEETYFIEILQNGAKKYDAKVIIGKEKQLLENFALNASVKLSREKQQAIFDGDLTKSVLLAWRAPISYVFDIGENAQVSMIRLYNSSFVNKTGSGPDNDLETVKFEVIDPKIEITKQNEYNELNKESNWKTVHTMSIAKDVYQVEIDPTQGRYWRMKVETVRGGKLDYPMATELQLLGSRVEPIQKDEIKDKYEVKSAPITKDFGQATTQEDIEKAIKIDGYKETEKYTVQINEDSKLPTGEQSGDFTVKATVKYPDNSTTTVEVKVKVNEKVELNYEDLNKAISKAEEAKKEESYSNNRQKAKESFDKVLEEAKGLVDKAKNQDEISSMTQKVEKSIKDLQQAFSLIYKTKYMAYSDVENPDYKLKLDERKTIQEGKDGSISESGEITDKKDEIIVIGNVSEGKEVSNPLPQIIEEDEELPAGTTEKIEGENRVTRNDIVYKIDEKTGKLLTPTVKEVVIKEGKALVIKLGTAEVTVYDYVREIEQNEVIVKFDKNLELGKQNVQQGQVGIKENRYIVTVKDGEEQFREIDEDYKPVVIQERKDTVITIGISTKIQDEKIKQLENLNKELEDKLTELEKNGASKEEVNELKDRINGLEGQLELLLEESDETVKMLEESIDKLESEVELDKEEINKLHQKIVSLENEVKENQAKIKALTKTIEELEKKEKEVKLFGTKLDKSPLENAIKDGKEYLENKKGNQTPYAQEGIDKLREVVEDAKKVDASKVSEDKPSNDEKPETDEYKLVDQDINKKLEEVSKDLFDLLSGEYKGGFESEIKEIGFVNKAGEKVTKFDTPMDVSLELKSLKLTDKDTLRVFHIGENGVDEVKDVKVDGQKVMFKSATFSPFVFVKGDKIAEAGNTGSATGTPAQGSQQNTDTQVQSTVTTNPETGDNGIMTYAIMSVVAIVALGGMVVVKKRAKNN